MSVSKMSNNEDEFKE